MKEFSEKELENAYKNMKMMEVPDMWDEIERNLAPKKTEEPEHGSVVLLKENRTNVRKYISIAAMIVLLFLPVSYTMYMVYKEAESKGENSAGSQELSDMASGEDIMFDSTMNAETAAEDGMAESGKTAAEDGMTESGKTAAEGGMAESGAEDSGKNGNIAGDWESKPEDSAGASSQGSTEDTAGAGTEGANGAAAVPESAGQNGAQDHHQPSEKAPEVQLEVQVTQVQNTAEGLWITAKVTKEGGSYRVGEEIEIFYDGTAYTKEALKGGLKLRLGKEENILKLLEILP